MIKEILTAAAVPHRRGRYQRPPEETYAVFFEDLESDSADPVPSAGALPSVCRHDVRVELYEPKPDDTKEAALEAELKSRGLSWTKQDRYWLQDVQRYQVIYELTYYTKH